MFSNPTNKKNFEDKDFLMVGQLKHLIGKCAVWRISVTD